MTDQAKTYEEAVTALEPLYRESERTRIAYVSNTSLDERMRRHLWEDKEFAYSAYIGAVKLISALWGKSYDDIDSLTRIFSDIDEFMAEREYAV